MNKTIAVLASLAVMGSAAECMAAAVVNLNNYDANVPIMYQSAVGAAIVAAPNTVYVELLGGPVGGPLVPVTQGVSTATSFTALDGDGFFDKGVGVIPGLADKAQGQFQLIGWSGAADQASAPLQGVSAVWTQATGAWNTTAVPAATPDSIALLIPATGLTIGPAVPEPSTIALGLLGAAALLIRRRK